MDTTFNTFYWGKNTEVKFEPFTEMPKNIPVTSCMIMAVLNKEYLVLSSPERGWGLPGGHVLQGETPEQTAIRELREEAAVKIYKDSLQVVGGWLAKKIHKTKKNSKYPDLAYQLLFIADIKDINQFAMRFEIFDRFFVPIDEVLNYATGENFKPIFNYVIKEYNDRFIKMKHEDKVSVIIPFFNTEKYIKKCLNSIAKQLFKNIEIFLINDGSTDSSAEICKKFTKSDKRFKLITHKKNKGLAAARNTGLDFITGNYVCFIDSDDYVDKDYIAKLLSAAKNNKADIAECQNYCVIGGKLTSKRSESDYNRDLIISSGNKVLRNYLRHSNPRISTSSVCNKIYKADLFKKNHISFDENLKRFEDSDIMYRLYEKTKKHVFITDKLYYHVHRENSIMRSLEKTNDGFEETTYIITKMLAYFYNNKEFFDDAMIYLRWNLTNTIQNLPDDDLVKFIEERIIKQSKQLKALYKREKEKEE